jgi:UDP-glucuronate decarboxylase
MKKIFITGVAGFLGSHLALYHLNLGDLVHGVDNFSSSSPTSFQFKLLNKHKNFFFYQYDIIHDDFLSVETNNSNFDICYNFACQASPPKYQASPIETMLTCVVGTKNVLDFARDHNAIMVHASTSEIYGDPLITPQCEPHRGQVNSYGPRSCYDSGKMSAEALCFDYLNKHYVDARVVRIFNTYGPHMDPNDGRVVSNFICQTLRNEHITMYGTGNQTRSFCYVDDLIQAIVAMGKLKDNPRTPINIGNPGEFTIMDLALKIISKINKVPNDVTSIQHKIILKKLPTDDPTQRRPDISLANKILNWYPNISLDLGLDKTIEYFKIIT